MVAQLTRTLLVTSLLFGAGVYLYRRHRQEQRDEQTPAQLKREAWSGMPKRYRYIPGMEQPTSKVRQEPWWRQVRRKRSA